MAVRVPEPESEFEQRPVVVHEGIPGWLVAILLVTAAAGGTTAGGFLGIDYGKSSGLAQLQSSGQGTLVNMFQKLADVSHDKALKITGSGLSGALNVLGDIFTNTSENTTAGLASGDHYLCGPPLMAPKFSAANFSANYTAICGSFNPLPSATDVPNFAKLFTDLTWALTELDNTIQEDP